MKKTFLAIGLFACSAAFAGDLGDAFSHSAAGMRVQGARMKVVAQNIANADSTGSTPGADPYRRKIITFDNKYDREKGIVAVKVDNISKDYKTKFKAIYDPSHPAADENGYVLTPNVSTSIESLDMKEAERSYSANLGVIETTKRMYMQTIDLLR